ncbi:MAG: DUF92 domain-containing protein [Gemmatimonadaceae bacterium]|nr:DUF92 domain-containing protein [Gemmatimonadaceae bacterium]
MLSRSGALAALLVGVVALAAGWGFVLVLLGFFLTSTALSRFRRDDKERLLSGIVAKGSARDAIQVFANGGIFALACLWYIATRNPAAIFMAAGALSAAAADTWATEVGSLSNSQPRSILNGRPVPAGTSGGITLLGTAAALAGSTFMGILATVSGWPEAFVACVIAGLSGAVADSLLGASVQSGRFCDACSRHTEREVDLCGTRTSHISGVAWINNDIVNLFCTLAGAGIAGLWVL